MKTFKPLFLILMLTTALVLSACDMPESSNGVPAALQASQEAGDDQGEDEGEVTETPEATETPEVTETPEASEEPEETEEAGARAGCEGNSGTAPTPLAGLAELYSVDEATILDYWCQGFGVGEIKKALKWADLTGTDAQTLFDMKAQGMGWGQIAKELGIHPGNKPDKEHGKPDKEHGNNGGNGNGNGNSGDDDDQGEDDSDGL